MRGLHRILLFAAGSAILVTAGAAASGKAASPIAPGRYCMKEKSMAYTGRNSPDVDIGDFLMFVEVKKSQAGYDVEFWNKQPDNDAILDGDSDRVHVIGDGSLQFDFDDGWGNVGRGRLSPDGRIRLTMIKHAPGNQIGRNYGSFRVSRKACAAPEFRNGH